MASSCASVVGTLATQVGLEGLDGPEEGAAGRILLNPEGNCLLSPVSPDVEHLNL